MYTGLLSTALKQYEQYWTLAKDNDGYKCMIHAMVVMMDYKHYSIITVPKQDYRNVCL